MSSRRQKPKKTGKGKGKNGKSSYWLAGDCGTFNYQTGATVSRTAGQTFTMRFEWVQGAEIIPAVGPITYVGQSFALSQVPNYTNWTINFDKFMLQSVEMVFTPSRSQQNGGSTRTPLFYCAPDFDSDATPTSIAEIQRHPRSLTCPLTTAFKRRFKPRVAKTIYKTGLASGYGEGDADQWVDCADASIPHFGFMYAVDAQTTTNQFGYQVTYVYTVTFALPIA
jgi:hypothetical protein